MEDVNQTYGVAALKKHNMKVSTIVFMIYSLVAAGAFGIEEMIPVSGPGLTIVMLLVFPVIWALPVSMTVAELGAVLPNEGGVYIWVKEAYGEFWAFVAGWWSTVSTYLSQATYVVLIVGYTSKFVPMNELQAYIFKVVIILVFTYINLIGIQEVGRVSSIFSIIILAAFGLVTVVGFMHWHYNPMIPFIPEGSGLVESIGGSLAIVLWMYQGYECLSNTAGEIQNPQVIPKGLLIAMPLIALSYVLPTLAGLACLGGWQSWSTEATAGTVGYVDVLLRYLGPAFGMVFLCVSVISQASMYNTYIASGSRGFFILAEDHLCPPILVKVSKKRGVPYVSVILIAIVTLVMVSFDFRTLLLFLQPLCIICYVVMGLALLSLRKKYPVSERRGVFVIPGGNLALYSVIACLLIIGIIGLLINGTEYFLLGFVSLFSGVFVYVIFKWLYGGLYKSDPENYPINPKTRLAKGDLGRVGVFFLLHGIYAFLGSFFIAWYEGRTGPQYYLEEYGSGLFSNFDLMLSIARYGGMAIIIVGLALFVTGKKMDGTAVEYH